MPSRSFLETGDLVGVHCELLRDTHAAEVVCSTSGVLPVQLVVVLTVVGR